jgi:membrane protease YdiL (CAAX protease family)
MIEADPQDRPWSIGHGAAALAAGFGASAVAQVALGSDVSSREVFYILVPIQTMVVIAVVAAFAAASTRRRLSLGLSFDSSDWVGIPIGVGLQVGVSLVLALVIELLLGGEAPVQEIVEAADDTMTGLDRVIVAVGAGLLSPISEELVFRGVVLRALLPRWGARAATYWSSGAFAAVHLLDPNAWLAVPVLFVVGVVLAKQAIATGRLARPVMTHAAFNLVSVAAMFLIE